MMRTLNVVQCGVQPKIENRPLFLAELSDNKHTIETMLVPEFKCVTKIRCMLNIISIVIPASEPPRGPVQKVKIMA
jgi:hypothetical protein